MIIMLNSLMKWVSWVLDSLEKIICLIMVHLSNIKLEFSSDILSTTFGDLIAFSKYEILINSIRGDVDGEPVRLQAATGKHFQWPIYTGQVFYELIENGPPRGVQCDCLGIDDSRGGARVFAGGGGGGMPCYCCASPEKCCWVGGGGGADTFLFPASICFPKIVIMG